MKQDNKNVFKTALVILLCLAVIGCGQSGQSGQSESAGSGEAAEAKPDYPTKNITFIVPVSPGGGFDTISRLFVQYWEKHFPNDVRITVKNVPGGEWNIGLTELYKAEPNGYTVGIMNFPGNVVSQIMGTAHYKLEEFSYIGRISDETYVGAVSKQSGVTSIEELIQKKDVKSGVVGLSSTAGLGTVIAAERWGLNLTPLPHEGSNEAIIAAMRGDVDYVQYPFGTLKASVVDSDDLTPIIVFSDQRLPDLPDVPSAAELGMEDLLSTVSLHRVVAAPPGTPDDILQILRESFQKAAAEPELVEKMIADSGSFNPRDAAFVEGIAKSSVSEFEKYKPLLEKYSK